MVLEADVCVIADKIVPNNTHCAHEVVSGGRPCQRGKLKTSSLREGRRDGTVNGRIAWNVFRVDSNAADV